MNSPRAIEVLCRVFHVASRDEPASYYAPGGESMNIGLMMSALESRPDKI